MKEYYKGIIKDFIQQHQSNLFHQCSEEELDEIVDHRAQRYLNQMEHSSNTQDDKEIYYQEMLTF